MLKTFALVDRLPVSPTTSDITPPLNSMTDWAGLLKWSLAQHNEEAPKDVKQLSEEDKKFIEAAMEDMVSDTIKQLKKIIANLTDSASTPDDLCEQLEDLLDYVDNIDVAIDYLKLGGGLITTTLCRNENAGVRAAACEIISTVAQNNPEGQKRLMEFNALDATIRCLSDTDDKVVAKAVSATASLVLYHPDACKPFLALGGLSKLVKIVADAGASTTEPSRAQRKALFHLPLLIKSVNPSLSTEEFATVTAVLVPALQPLVYDIDHKDIMEHSQRLALELCQRDSSLGPQLQHQGTDAGVKRARDTLQQELSQCDTADKSSIEAEVALLDSVVTSFSGANIGVRGGMSPVGAGGGPAPLMLTNPTDPNRSHQV